MTRASELKEGLRSKLNEIGLVGEEVNINQPIIPQLSDADVLVNGFSKINKSIIDASPKLKMVHQSGIGVDNVDVDYCTSKSIYVANVPLANAVSVAEHTIFFMLYLAKNIKNIIDGDNVTMTSLMTKREATILGSELQAKTLFIIGLGATGIEVAKRAKSFGMHIIAITKDPFSKKPDIDRTLFVNEIGGPEMLSKWLVRADYVSLHIPLTEETAGLIGENELNSMKNSSFMINVARAPIVLDNIEPLRDKTIALLIQLPPSMEIMPGLEGLRNLLPLLGNRFRYAVEVRHHSWFQDLAYNFFVC